MGSSSTKETLAAFAAIMVYSVAKYLPNRFASILLIAVAIVFFFEFAYNLRKKAHFLYLIFYISLCAASLILSFIKFGGAYARAFTEAININTALYAFAAIALTSGLATSYKFGDERKKKLVIAAITLILIYAIFILWILAKNGV